MENINKYDSVLGAKYLLALAYEKNIALNVTKVQKLLYILYCYFLAKHNRQIFEETPKAWPYGPVFPRTRNKVDFGKVYKTSDFLFQDISREEILNEKFNSVIEKYSHFSASQLSDWSHMDGSPWDKTVKKDGFNWGDYIPNEYIIDYFKELEI